MGKFWEPFSLVLKICACAILLCGCFGCSERGRQSSSTALAVRLVHGPELKPFADAFKSRFEAGKPRLADGRAVQLEFIQQASLYSMQHIASGELKTEGWFAQGPALVEFVNSHLSNLGPKQVECDPLFGTPIVVAINNQDRHLFSADESSFSWDASIGGFLEFEASQEGKAKFSMLHGDPRNSVTGLSSLMQLASLALGAKGAMLEVEALKRGVTLANLKRFESIALNYPTQDAAMLQRLNSANRKAGLFAVTSEQQLAVYNQSSASAASPLIALYPEEGSIWDQYSLCISDADWVTPAHRAALRDVRAALTNELGQLLAKQMGFRPAQMVIGEVAPLSAQFGVNTALPKTSLPPASAAGMTYLADNWLTLARPAAILFLLDASGSTDDILSLSKTEIRNWLAGSSKQDLKSIVTFAQQVKAETEFTSNVGKLIATLDIQQSLGGSAVYDALKRSLDLLANRDLQKHRKTLLIVTDGEDKNSQSSFERIKDLLEQRMSTTAFSLIVVAVQRGQANLNDLKSFAQVSGGLYLEASPANLSTVLKRALSEL